MSAHSWVNVEDAGPGWSRIITRVLDVETGRSETLSSVEIDAEAVWTLIGHLLNAIQPQSLARDVKAGNCATCQNTRLVQATVNGREQSVRCPDCDYGTSPEPLKPYYWVSREARIQEAPDGR